MRTVEIYRPYRLQLASPFVRVMALLLGAAFIASIAFQVFLSYRGLGAATWIIMALFVLAFGYALKFTVDYSARLGIHLASRNLVVRPTRGAEIELPVGTSRATVERLPRDFEWIPGRTISVDELFGDALAPLADAAIPKKNALIIHDGRQAIRCDFTTGMSLRRMRELAERVNEELKSARQHYNFPEPTRID